jgi:dTDP-4-dehydrorhamnose reductase
MQPLELWGGLECTVNRTHDRYHDQIVLSGHHDRPDDLDLFAGLGLGTIRYPVLWERTMPRTDGTPDWTWPDARLARLRELEITPIVGLVHHGSGPPHTHLLDDGFAGGLGTFAGLVAARYPWVEQWTPVNEPVTTARFAALYGHWYPHASDERSFWLALLNQIDATRAAMRAIRRINPGARLVQTDDLGRTHATAPLADQAAFYNARRWAGWDLLFGRLNRDHVLWDYLVALGLGDRLRRIADDPCPPDVVGVNHYLTSDRVLDHRLDRFPAHLHGDNGRIAFADTEAVRVLDPPPPGLAGALDEAWTRYGTPIALTEVHNGSTREEQLRWAAEAWDTAVAARTRGIDVRAVTAWALLGSHGWNTLLTGGRSYEPGVFDTANGTPRPTALAALWRGLPRDADRHPVANEPGWWRRADRLTYGDPASAARVPGTVGLLLICGASEALTNVVATASAARGIRYRLLRRDINDADEIRSLVATFAPWGIVTAGGVASLDTTGLTADAGRAGHAQMVDRLLDDLIDGRGHRRPSGPFASVCLQGAGGGIAPDVLGRIFEQRSIQRGFV